MSARRRIVVDASVLVDALSSSGEIGDRARDALRGVRLSAPEHLRVEVFHGIRGRVLGNKLDHDAAHRALQRLSRLEVGIVRTALLLERMWELRTNLSGYDAAYAAAAEHLGVGLVTADAGLAAAPGLRCTVIVA